MSNVKLAIRVRPFTERELRCEQDRTPVVNVENDKTVTITNLKVSASGAGDSRERIRRYHADYTFDSACAPTNPEYASQEKVFEGIGRDVLASLSRLSSVCVLAYGQSATGKTHTMMGTDAQPGLVPRLCREIATADPCDVTISFLEIYNERVHDLLAGEDPPLSFHSLPRRRGNAQKDLRVREHPSRGPYVQNLRRVAVNNTETLLALVSEGTRRRRTAATRRNASSSRSHALLELRTSRVTLHLADLAGSEKASWEGCGGGRQKEGANINKSLVALSNVISALVCSGNGRGRFVPYRDSALTWLLKDCFTGGACTYIIATVSPSLACYGESASTLRWSSRARQLPAPRVGGAPTNARAALLAQYNRLLAELDRHHIRYVPETGKIFYDDTHWTLQLHNQLEDNSEKKSKIGNLLNMLQPSSGINHELSTSANDNTCLSSDDLNSMDKTIATEINKEVDKLLGPTLERTRSGSDFEMIAPIRHKKRQYRSQEVLPIEKTLQDPSPHQSHTQIIEATDKTKNPHVSILYDNQRAEIVASVTERLYSKLKKKEEAAVSKVESVVDKKIMEPLSELKICTNARQRLMELSQKALRNKRRIGIPAFTQTRSTVTRVRDQGNDVQTDLESYFDRGKSVLTVYCDASTETQPMTPRCKEIAIGPKCGSLYSHDKSTATEFKEVIQKSSFMMTDDLAKLDRFTQTRVLPPPRRKRRSPIKLDKCIVDDCASPIISINISQRYMDTDSQSSDECLDQTVAEQTRASKNVVTMTPDLLTNHSNIEPPLNESCQITCNKVNQKSQILIKNKPVANNNTEPQLNLTQNSISDFPEIGEFSLPRVSVNSSTKANHNEIKDMILGRNQNIYPYNIVLSPPREIDNTKRIVKFKDVASSPAEAEFIRTNPISSLDSEINGNRNCMSMPSSLAEDYKKGMDGSQKTSSTETIESGKVDSDSFVWEGGDIKNTNESFNPKNVCYTPVYKSSHMYKTARTKFYKEFLGLDKLSEPVTIKKSVESESCEGSSSDSIKSCNSLYNFQQSKKFFEEQYKKHKQESDKYEQLERQLFASCCSLEKSVDKYDRYLTNYRKNSTGLIQERTPKKYLQHLVQLRKEVIKADSDTTDSAY